ncbi:MAG TPA: TIGR02444 family protein [Rhodopila sp.]
MTVSVEAKGMRTGAFWAFSLRLYARPGVQQVLLRLQDQEGADVTMVLYILWCASCGHRLDAPALTLVAQRTRSWREGVIGPLRTARRAMKGLVDGSPAAEALRERVKEAELEAERLLHCALEARRAAVPAVCEDSAVAAARAGLAAYAAMVGFMLPASASDLLIAALPTSPDQPSDAAVAEPAMAPPGSSA